MSITTRIAVIVSGVLELVTSVLGSIDAAAELAAMGMPARGSVASLSRTTVLVERGPGPGPAQVN